MPDADRSLPSLSIAQALQQLPLESPERSAWPLLAARLQARRRRPLWPYALAATLALAVGIAWQRLPVNEGVAPTGPVAAGSNSALLALMDESAKLERLISALHDPAVASASSAMLSLEMEDQLGRIDADLSNPATDGEQRLALWQQRVGLLRSYAGMESTRRYQGSDSERLDARLVAVY